MIKLWLKADHGGPIYNEDNVNISIGGNYINGENNNN